MRNEIFRTLATVALVAVVLPGCAAETEGEAAGSCKLSCSQRYAAAQDYKIISVVQPPANFSFSCIMDDPADPDKDDGLGMTNVPIQVRFQIYKEKKAATSGQGEEDAPGGGGETTTTVEPIHPDFPEMEARVPVQGIGFQPTLFGVMADWKTHPDLTGEGGTSSSAQFSGVETPPSEWCSDSCGQMTYEFRPACTDAGTNTIGVGLVAGAAIPPPVATITLGN